MIDMAPQHTACPVKPDGFLCCWKQLTLRRDPEAAPSLIVFRGRRGVQWLCCCVGLKMHRASYAQAVAVPTLSFEKGCIHFVLLVGSKKSLVQVLFSFCCLLGSNHCASCVACIPLKNCWPALSELLQITVTSSVVRSGLLLCSDNHSLHASYWHDCFAVMLV